MAEIEVKGRVATTNIVRTILPFLHVEGVLQEVLSVA
jgi:hypothetical protein